MSTPLQSLLQGRRKAAVAIAASAALGGIVAGCGSSGSSSTTARPLQNSAQVTPQAGVAGGGSAPQAGVAANGAQGAPQGTPPGMGTVATGAAAAKAKAAALAKHAGTVERVLKLPDGSYEVHVTTKTGEVHVLVSKAFAVTGTQQGGPPAGMAPGNGTGTPPAAPNGAAPGTSSGSTSNS